MVAKPLMPWEAVRAICWPTIARLLRERLVMVTVRGLFRTGGSGRIGVSTCNLAVRLTPGDLSVERLWTAQEVISVFRKLFVMSSCAFVKLPENGMLDSSGKGS